MNMKEHLLAALRDELEEWEALLDRLSEEQICAPDSSSGWSIKDNIAHLWAWQQRTLARAESARLDREPVFPRWPQDINPEEEGATDRINAWIYETCREQSWAEVHQNWKVGFEGLLESAAGVAERDLLETERYPWLKPYSLANYLIASYHHHLEHIETLRK